jgi:hypothetical protein
MPQPGTGWEHIALQGSRQVPLQCGITIRLTSGWGQPRKSPCGLLCQLSPAAEIRSHEEKPGRTAAPRPAYPLITQLFPAAAGARPTNRAPSVIHANLGIHLTKMLFASWHQLFSSETLQFCQQSLLLGWAFQITNVSRRPLAPLCFLGHNSSQLGSIRNKRASIVEIASHVNLLTGPLLV